MIVKPFSSLTELAKQIGNKSGILRMTQEQYIRYWGLVVPPHSMESIPPIRRFFFQGLPIFIYDYYDNA